MGRGFWCRCGQSGNHTNSGSIIIIIIINLKWRSDVWHFLIDNEKAEKSTDDTVESLQKKKLLTGGYTTKWKSHDGCSIIFDNWYFIHLKTRTDAWHFLIDYSVRKQIVDEENLAASTPVIFNPVIEYIEDEFVVFYDSDQSFQRGAALSGYYTEK